TCPRSAGSTSTSPATTSGQLRNSSRKTMTDCCCQDHTGPSSKGRLMFTACPLLRTAARFATFRPSPRFGNRPPNQPPPDTDERIGESNWGGRGDLEAVTGHETSRNRRIAQSKVEAEAPGNGASTSAGLEYVVNAYARLARRKLVYPAWSPHTSPNSLDISHA